MGQVILILLWGLVVLGSFVALGRLLARALDRTLLDDVPMTAGVGMAGMVFIGGLLNLAHLATTGVVMAVVVGLIALEGLVSIRGRPASGGPSASMATGAGGGRVATFAAIGLLFTVVMLRYVLSLGQPFWGPDDLPYYLPQIVKLLETGTLGVEPYLFRQLVTMNGQIFLAALGCCVAPPEYAALADPGICWIILAGLFYTFLRRDVGLPIPISGLLATTSLLFGVPLPGLSGRLSGPVLMVTAVRLMFTGITASAAPTRGRLVLAGLVLGSLASLKSTYLIYAVLFLASWSLLAPWRMGIPAIATRSLPVALLAALVMSPWMIQQYLSSGTLLYPILGKGNMFSNHGIPFEFHDDPLKTRLTHLLLFATNGSSVPVLATLLAAAVYFARSPGVLSRALLAASMSAVFGSYVIGVMVPHHAGAAGYARIIQYVSCALPGLLGIALAARGDRVGLVLACAFFLSLGANWQESKLSFKRTLQMRIGGEKTFYLPTDYEAKIRRAQSLTEPGERILADVMVGFFFDFRRNPIWNFDVPGLSSPPPGLPLTRDWKGLQMALDRRSLDLLPPPAPVADFRDFLVRSGVDYLLFERDPDRVYYLYLDIATRTNVPPDGNIAFERMMFLVMKMTHESLLTVARDRHVVFDDGNLILLDLRQGRQPGDPPFVEVPELSKKRHELLGKIEELGKQKESGESK